MSDTPTAHPVARYYDSNTRRFLLVGGGGATHSMHRHLWGPGVASTAQAAAYIDHLIAERILDLEGAAELTILDIGCGVGGTLFHLAEAFPRSRLHGITISAKQRDLADRLARRKGVEDRCLFHLGDFQTAELDVEADIAVAVEALAHAESAVRFFAWAAARVRPRGHVLIADDFLRDGALDAIERRRVAELRSGWRAPAIGTVAECVGAAAREGFELVDDEDLTHLVRLGRPRDRLIALLSPVLRRLRLASTPFFGNMIGGGALHAGLRDGLFTYRLVAFQKGASNPDH